MLVSKKTLSNLIDKIEKVDDQNITTACNAIGLEVESIIRHPLTKGLIIGQLLSIKKHHDANNLNICEVNVGTEILQIVCGAANLRPNVFVIVATLGAKLFNGKLIDRVSIRGVESNGMLCAYSELTPYAEFIGDNEVDEIIMIDSKEKLELGSNNYQEFIGFDDTIYDLSIPANRNDLQALAILAYELAAKLNLKYIYNLSKINEKIFNQKSNDKYNSLNFINYENITISSSDWKIKKILMNNGIKPINNILDKLSLITLYTNVPTHVYDANKTSRQLYCDYAKTKSKFTALNKNIYDLSNEDLCIFDEKGLLGLAGIMGGQSSMIDNQTKSIVIEIANFNYLNIRKTALRLNLNSDASKRASKPLSTYLIQLTIDMILKLFGSPKNEYYSNYENWNKKEIIIDEKQFKNFLNIEYSFKIVEKMLAKYGFNINDKKILAPIWRLDIINQQDIFEEFLKEVDINNLKSQPISEVCLPIIKNSENKAINLLKILLLDNYFNEVKTYNLISKKELENFNLFDYTSEFEVNTSNSNRQFLRKNLIDKLLKVYKYNFSYKNNLIPIFELQKIYLKEKTTTNLTCLITMDYKIDSLKRTMINFDLSYLSSIVMQIGSLFNKKYILKPFDKSKYFYNNECVSIEDGSKIIGYIGKIKSNLLKEYDLEQKQIYSLSINLNSELSNFYEKEFKFAPISNYQVAYKDINISTNNNINHYLNKLQNCSEIQSLEVTSIYKKEKTTVYTIRYYLKNDVSYTASDLENINQKLIKLVISK